jgi:phage baseplate assembly protein W
MTTPVPVVDLALPVRFDGRSLVLVSGDARQHAVARIVLLTEPGELPWRTDFGTGLGRLRHQRIDAVAAEVLRVQVRDAFRRWLPSVTPTDVTVEREAGSDQLTLRVALGGTGALEVTP